MNNPMTQWFNRTRDSIEARFFHWGLFCSKHPWWIILFVTALLAWSTTNLDQLTIDTSTEGFLHKDDPIRVYYDQFQREFGRDEKAVILVETAGGSIFDTMFLQRLTALHKELEDIPQIADVKSLVNARHTYGANDELHVDDLLEEIPETAEQLAQLEEIVRNNPTYINQFVNPAMNKAAILVTMDTYSSAGIELKELDGFDDEFDELLNEGFQDELDDGESLAASGDISQRNEEAQFLTGQEVGTIIQAMDATLARHQQTNFVANGTGSPYMMYMLTDILGRDMAKFSLMGIAAISFLLLVLFRRVVMIFLPVFVAVLSTYFTIALMAFLKIPITTSAQILPSFLLAVSVGSSVHVFTAFFHSLNEGKNKQQALAHALGHAGLAIVMTGLTTAGGLLSFYSAEIKPVSDFGIITPMGILCTLFFSLVLLPALIAVLPIKNKKLHDNSNGLTQRFLKACATASTEHSWKVIAGWMLLLVPSLYIASGVSISHYPLGWFPESSNYRQTTDRFGEEFGGASYMEIIINTEKENGIQQPEVLQAMEQVQNFAMGFSHSGVKVEKTVAITDINKELHQALNNNNPDYYRIPNNQQLVAQELLLFENSGSDDLEELVNTQFSKARITMKMPFVDATHYPPYLQSLMQNIEGIIGDLARVELTGILPMMSRTVVSLLDSTVKAYIIAFCIITPLMIFLIGSLRTGLISMIPNLTPIVITIALMAILDIPLDAFTLLIGSIALGLAVDDTIHFMHNFQRFYAHHGDAGKAVHETLKTTGQALFFTSIVLACSFFLYMFATMNNLFAFGLLTGFCIIMAFLADVLLAPALVTVLTHYKEKTKERKQYA